MRDEWLAAIAAHVRRVEQDGADPLDPALPDVARRLAGALGDDLGDLPAWHLLGRFHMHRDGAIYHAGEDGWQADNAAMMAAFGRCLLAVPGALDGLDVPADIRDAVARHAMQPLAELSGQAYASGDPEAIAAVPARWQHVASALPADSPARPQLLLNMGMALHNRFLLLGDPADIDAAVAIGREAIAAAPDDHPALAAMFAQLSQATASRFGQRGNRGDIDEAVASIRRALELLPPQSPLTTGYLSAYGVFLLQRFDSAGDRADLDRAVAVGQLAAAQADEAARPALLRNAAEVLLRRSEEVGSSVDLDDAIATFRQTLELARPGSGLRLGSLSGLGTALRLRFARSSDPRDLDGAVAAAAQSVAEVRPADPERPIYLGNLGSALVLRATLSGGPEDVEEAIAACRDALAAAGPGHRLRGAFLANLSGALLTRSDTTPVLAEAIVLAREAVAVTPPGHPDRGRFLIGLCGALLDRFDNSDDPADVAEAVDVGRQMIEATRDGRSYRPNALLIFGEALRQQAVLPGQPPSRLDEAISVMREAVRDLPPGPARAEASASLAVALRQRFRRAGDPDDLDGAVAIFRAAVLEGGPEAGLNGALDAGLNVAEVADAQYNLGTTLLLRFEHQADPDDVDDAAAALRLALAAPGIDRQDLARYRSRLSEALRLLFARTGRRADIDEAVALSRQAIAMTPAGHPELSDYQLALGKALAEAGGTDADGTSAGGTDAGGEGREGARSELAARLAALVDIETTDQLPAVLVPGALDDALRLAELLDADETPDLDVNAVLGRYFWLRHLALPPDPADGDSDSEGDRDGGGERDGDGIGHRPIDDESALFAWNAAVDFYTPLFAVGRWVPDGLRPAIALGVADDALVDLFDRIALLTDAGAITAAIALWRRILDAIPADDPARGRCTGALGTALYFRYAADNTADLDESLAALRQAVADIGGDDRFQPVFRAMLSETLRAGSGLAATQADRDDALDAAVIAARQAVDGLDDTDDTAERAYFRSQVGAIQMLRYQATGDLAELDAAVTLLSEALADIPAGDVGAAMVAASLSEALHVRFTVTGDRPALDGAVDAARRAVADIPDGHPQSTPAFLTLGACLRSRADLNEDSADLAAAIEALNGALARATPGSPTWSLTQGNLSHSLLTRFTWTGEPADLDAAIGLAQQAVAAIPAGNASRASLAALLATELLTRFEQTGNEPDLDAAIAMSGQAADALPPAHPDRAGYLSGKATALQRKYQRTEELGYLEQSIAASEQALAAVPDGHPSTSVFQLILAASLRLRCVQTENEAGLQRAVDLSRRAAEPALSGPAARAWLLSELGTTLMIRFMFSEDQADIDEAADCLRQAIAATANRPAQAQHQQRLASALALAYEQNPLPAYKDEVLDLYTQVTESAAAPAVLRIAVAELGASFAADLAPATAANLLETAVRLLPIAASRQLRRIDQQHALGQFTFLSSQAAEMALTAGGPGAPARALGLLELGRAVLQGQALDTRRDLLDLYAAHPALASRFEELRDLLDAPDGAGAGSLDVSAGDAPIGIGLPPALTRAGLGGLAAGGVAGVAVVGAAGADVVGVTGAGQDAPVDGADRLRAGSDFSALLSQIRSLPGFTSFLLPPAPAELTRHAGQGPIVVFNIGLSRCDALIVVPSGIEQLPLPRLEGERLAAVIDLWEEALDQVNGPQRAAAEGVLSGILEWLWDVAAEPVLRYLGAHQTPGPGQPWPRVWWAPGGLLGMLPVHAAGHHQAGGGATVLDRVVSSYTPTVRALSYARGRARSAPPTRSLIVAMPTTPGIDAPLPGVRIETDELARILPSPTILIEQENTVTESTPTRDRVLAAIDQAGIAHFTCHAASQAGDPSSSQIYLHDYRENPFTVASLVPARLRHAQLAFLSACQTARNEDVDLLDEAIHLTSAFQLAGFPHVIGTLWPILDSVSAHIAIEFYRRLGSQPGTLAVARSAQALHDTIRNLRDSPGGAALPSYWAAYIHAGA